MKIDLEFEQIVDKASEVFGDIERAKDWLLRPHVFFNWEKPADYPDYVEVYEILERIGNGILR